MDAALALTGLAIFAGILDYPIVALIALMGAFTIIFFTLRP